MTVCPPPSLHLKLGFNKLLIELGKKWPELFLYVDSLGISFEPYFGRTLEGNEVDKFIRNLDTLETLIPSDLMAFVDCMRAFSGVVDSCFGFELDPYYKDVVKKFSQSLKTLKTSFDVTETVKFHIIVKHVPQGIEMLGCALGQFSEQEVENAHSVFDRIWRRYKVKNRNTEVYRKNYFKTIMVFNSDHI